MTETTLALPTFLLVDDLEENLIALEGLLRRDGLKLLKARSGPEALELLLTHDVALSLIDVQMPGMDGFELAELMRGTEKTKRVPIIFLTAGSADVQRRFRGYDAGAVDFLTKPIEAHILQSKAQVFLELWLERQEVARQRDELKIATSEISRLLIESRLTAEALKEADQRKDEFLATLAHELRNPLAPLRNGLQLMHLAADNPEEVSRTREMMERQLTHMVRLVDDLLDISRVTTGKVSLRLEPVNVHAAVTAAVEASRSVIDAGQHTLNLNLPADPLWLQADSTRVTQIIGNLLTNAAKYTKSGGVITVSVEQKGSGVTITVSDTGIGIPKDMLPKVFDLFTQVGGSLDRSQGGLGIGLALVKRLVELHGGTVVSKSGGPGTGSTFSVTLPFGEKITPSLTGSSIEAEKKSGSYKILVVDDNIDGAESLALILSFEGHNTQIAHSGPAALSSAEKFRPDLVFLDIGLPEMNGYEVATTLRADETKYGCPTLVAVTGWGSEDDRKRSKAAGFDHHLTKPVENTQIIKLLRDL